MLAVYAVIFLSFDAADAYAFHAALRYVDIFAALLFSPPLFSPLLLFMLFAIARLRCCIAIFR